MTVVANDLTKAFGQRRLVSVKEAARILGVSKSVLDRWRLKDMGPPWVRLGTKKVAYALDDLAAFIEANKFGGGRKRAA